MTYCKFLCEIVTADSDSTTDEKSKKWGNLRKKLLRKQFAKGRRMNNSNGSK